MHQHFHHHEKDEQKQKHLFNKLAVAATVGATIGLMYFLKEGEIGFKEKTNNLAKKLHKSRKEVQENIKNIFGEVSEELENKYTELRENIFAELDYIRERALLNKEKYEALIDRTVEEFSKDKQWSEHALETLRQELKSEWDKIQEMFH